MWGSGEFTPKRNVLRVDYHLCRQTEHDVLLPQKVWLILWSETICIFLLWNIFTQSSLNQALSFNFRQITLAVIRHTNQLSKLLTYLAHILDLGWYRPHFNCDKRDHYQHDANQHLTSNTHLHREWNRRMAKITKRRINHTWDIMCCPFGKLDTTKQIYKYKCRNTLTISELTVLSHSLININIIFSVHLIILHNLSAAIYSFAL